MVYLPTFTIKITPNHVGKYTIPRSLWFLDDTKKSPWIDDIDGREVFTPTEAERAENDPEAKNSRYAV